MKIRFKPLGIAMLMAALLSPLVSPPSAQASSNGKRNTALLLGAGAVYELLNHKTTNGLLLGAGAAYAYKKYGDSRKSDRRRRVTYYRSNTYISDPGYGGYSRTHYTRTSTSSHRPRYGGSSLRSTRRYSTHTRHARAVRHRRNCSCWDR